MSLEKEDKSINLNINNDLGISIIKKEDNLNENKKYYNYTVPTSKFFNEKSNDKEKFSDEKKNNQSFSRTIDIDKSNNELLSNYENSNSKIINILPTSSNVKNNGQMKESPHKKIINSCFSCFKEKNNYPNMTQKSDPKNQ